jgi:hypothetical protein
VTWTSQGQDGSGDGVFGQLYGPSGIPLGAEFRVNTHTTERQAYASVAFDGNSRFVVAWQSRNQDGSSEGIFAQRFAPDPIFEDGFESVPPGPDGGAFFAPP